MKGYSLLLVVVLAATVGKAQVKSGDEQGLEVTVSPTLQNERAVDEALHGWWKESRQDHGKRMEWFREVKFGCFIHWGVYAKAAGTWKGKALQGYAEHLMRRQKITKQEYIDSLVSSFNPSLFNADEWMRMAYEAGMRYFIITAKHHDGFAMFPSDVYPYDIRMTRMTIDPMMELAKAARKYGIKFGFYYSHAFDWEHPEAPGNDWEYENPGGDKLLHGAEWWLKYPEFLPKAQAYVNEKAIPQLAELVHRYHPDILWFDTPHKLPLSENLRILKYLRKIAPEVVINGRLARMTGQQFGDYESTGDRAAYFFPVEGDWESIPTTNESYGYNENDRSHKPAAHFIRLLASATARGGNILMNIGPKGDGSWDKIDVAIMNGIATWMKDHYASVHGVQASGLPTQSWGETTLKGDSLFLHVFRYPGDGRLYLSGMNAAIVDAAFLASGEKVKKQRLNKTDWLLKLPAGKVDCIDTVILVQKKGEIIPSATRLLLEDMDNELLAFDAVLAGEQFQHGDGKRMRNYIYNWKNPAGSLNWEVKNYKTSSYEITLEYTGESADNKGKMELVVDGKSYPFEYTTRAHALNKVKIATVPLKAGTHQIVLKGVEFEGKEFLRPMRMLVKYTKLPSAR